MRPLRSSTKNDSPVFLKFTETFNHEETPTYTLNFTEAFNHEETPTYTLNFTEGFES